MEIKGLEAENRIQYSSTKEEALNNAILATEIYMKAIKLASGEPDRKRLKSKCMKLLARAEEIKKIEDWSISRCPHEQLLTEKTLRTPLSTRILSTREQMILLESSKLNGTIFPPWTFEPGDDLFRSMTGETLYTDLTKFKLSDRQRKIFAGWNRPVEAFQQRQVDVGINVAPVEPTMTAINEIDLVQDITADCSVVASLCAVVARVGNGLEQLLQTIFYPYDKIRHTPVVSWNGKYIFCLHFNGCFRKVIIDDRLPTSSSSRTLHVVDRRNPGLLWPALLEKAYLKVRAGYDFPGSNSGTDLWVLTGWVPEQIFLQREEVNLEQLWRRVFKSYEYGDVMVTLGTGRLSRIEEEGYGLVGEHDYAVVDMKEVDGKQSLLVKNPWCDGTIWRGPSSLAADKEKGKENRTTMTSTQEIGKQDLAAGAFWIAFDQVIQNFESLYLNWNPVLFRYREDHHFSWSIPLGGSPTCFTRNPQYSIQSRHGGPVWVLLSRHFCTEEGSLISSPVTFKSPRSPLGFIALYVFDTNGMRVHLSDGALLRGPFVDSPQSLVRLDISAMKCYTVVVAQQDLPLSKYSFSLSAYSRTPVDMGPARNALPHVQSLSGCWTPRNAGGNASSPFYPSNPQFSLVLADGTDIILILETTKKDLPIHMKMVWGGGERVTAITAKDIVVDSGDHRRGCAFAEALNVPAGFYTIVCSTFDRGEIGDFTLRVESKMPLEIRPVANEAAGRLSLYLPPLFLRNGIDRMLAPIKASRLTNIRVVAKHGPSSGHIRSPLKISLEQSQGPHKRVLASSFDGDFSDAAAGIRVADFDIGPEITSPAGVWLVVERFSGVGSIDEVNIEVLSDALIEIGHWGIGDG